MTFPGKHWLLSTVSAFVRAGTLFGAGRNRTVQAQTSQATAQPLPPVELSDRQRTPLAEVPIRATAETLPTLVSGPRGTGWWGILLLVMIETVVVTSLIVSYLYLRTHAPRWPPTGIEPSELTLPVISTAILIASVAPMYWSVWAVRHGRQTQMQLALFIVMLMGIAFLALKYVEYSDKGFNWSTNAYGSIVWTMVGFHSAHVIAAMLKSLGMFIVGLRGFFDERRHLGLQTNAIYWYFVVIIWIPLFLAIYIAPRVL